MMEETNSLLLKGTNQFSLNKAIGIFLSAPTQSIIEFSLSLFGMRYQDLLPFAEVLAHNHESELCEE